MKKQSKIGIGIIAGFLFLAVIIIATVLITSSSDSRNYQRHMDLAQRYMDELQYEQAIAEYEAAIAIEPDNAEAYQALAKAYIAIGEYELAVDVLNRGVAQTGSEVMETYKSDVLEMVYASMNSETDTDSREQDIGVHDSGEDHSVPETGGIVPPKVTDEADTSEENAPAAEPQDDDGAVTIIVTWDGRYEDGSLKDLYAGLTGTLDDGSEVYFSDEGTEVLAADGTLAAQMDFTVTETEGSIQVTIYRTDGFYNFEVQDGIGYVLHNTNGLSNSDVRITMIDAEGKSTQLDVEAKLYRSYTGLWFFGIGIDHGMLADYDSSWIMEGAAE